VNLFKGDSQSPPPSLIVLPGSDRRTFLRRMLGGIAIAVPAMAVLAAARPAGAIPEADPCAKTYVKLITQYCSNGESTCTPAGDPGDCINQYARYSSTTLQLCDTYEDVVGICGSLDMARPA
jgi:hypothetical protein